VSVKRSQSATRVLAALETIAHHQPVGTTELARLLDDDKSAVQRAIMTLADSGWIRPAAGSPTRWELTAHILAIAHIGHSSNDLRQRARRALEKLHEETGETVLLTVPDQHRFVVIDTIESRQLLRTVPPLGMSVPVRGSATSRATLPYMSPAQQIEILGAPPDPAMIEDFAATIARGFSVSDGDVVTGSTNIAAPILELGGFPVGTIVVSAPTERLPPAVHSRIGTLVVRAAQSVSRSTASYPRDTNRPNEASAAPSPLASAPR
jgi:DNA-binding IclR family transcriptional regulator